MIRTLIASTMLMTGVLASAAHAETTYIHAGHLMAVPGEVYATEQTVIIEDGRILSVEDGYIAPEEGVELIDLSEGYVLPGLIDSHVHLTSEFSPDMRVMMLSESEVDEALDGAMYARRTVEAGFTTVQDVGSSPEAIFSLRDAIMEGDLTGPRIRAAGASISPTGGHGDVNGLSPALMK